MYRERRWTAANRIQLWIRSRRGVGSLSAMVNYERDLNLAAIRVQLSWCVRVLRPVRGAPPLCCVVSERV
jgi:hypothetical protein